MRMTKKKVFVAALAICLIATISMGTLAWFTAQDSVNNNFEVMDSLRNFEVDVWEIVDSNLDGTLEYIGKNVSGTNGTTYEDVVPGGSYMKEVYVENNSNNALADQYIKMEVTFTNYAALRAMVVDMSDLVEGEPLPVFDCTAMLEGAYFTTNQNDDAPWWYDETATRFEGNTATYVFYLKKVLKDADDAACLFKSVKIPETMDINDADYLIKTNGFEINVVAYAIQSANIKDPEGTSVLDHVRYAFGDPWTNSNSQPGTELYPEQELQ